MPTSPNWASAAGRAASIQAGQPRAAAIRAAYDRFYTGDIAREIADFARANAMHDWLHFHDALSGGVAASQHWELMAYLPFAAVPWYTEFASHANATSAHFLCTLPALACR